jgi:hypothetical protein
MSEFLQGVKLVYPHFLSPWAKLPALQLLPEITPVQPRAILKF